MQAGYVPKVQIFVCSSEFAGSHLVWTHTGSQAQPSVMDGYIGFVPDQTACSQGREDAELQVSLLVF